jgi:hypothetical protein
MLVKLIDHQMDSELCLDHFPANFISQKGLNKDLTDWLGGARAPTNYQLKAIVSISKLNLACKWCCLSWLN